MAQSYDVYFARMILTLGLVEREAIQGALHAYQQMGKGAGFPRWLVEHHFMDIKKVERVAQELERWFLAERRRAMGFEEPEEPKEATEEGKPALPLVADSSDESLAVPPDEESSTPVVMATPAVSPPMKQTSSRPAFVIPEKPATPPPQPRPKAKPPSGRLKTPSGRAKAASGHLKTPSGKMKTPSGKAPAWGQGAPPPPKKKPSSRQPALPATPHHAPARESQRAKKPSLRVKKPEEAAIPPAPPAPASPAAPPSPRARGSSGRMKPVAPAPDKQWALYEKATKDPLSRLVGQRLGRTEVVKLLHTAEIMTTFEGRHGDDERGALIKVLRPDKVKDKVALERFTREASALSKIDHPNIARILESGTAEGVRYMSMEVGSGEPLSTLLERAGRLPPERVARIGRGVALGLAAAHRAGIIHRDLRPANVLVEEGGTVKLVGFGVARDVAVPGRLTATGHITGHPSYVAPEIASQAEITPKADVYSLGIVLFLALAGRLPFESRSVVKLVGLHLNAPAPKLASIVQGCPGKLAALVDRLLLKDPAARPEAMEVANVLAAKDLLEGYDASAWSQDAKKPDTEEELRRAMATDENPAVDASAEMKLGGPACAACELPIGLTATSLHGNQICKKCAERVEALELCAACLLEIEEKDGNAADVAVFAGHIYCRSCTRRVRLPCAVCKKEAPLAGLASGQTKAKGELIVHAACAR